MYRKIFTRLIKPWQIILIGVGSFLGLLIFWVAVQAYFDVTKILSQRKDVFGGQYLVLNKSVSIVNTLGIPSTGFSPENIEEIKSLPGVKKVGSFSANTFSAMIGADLGAEGVSFKTQIFFEAVPDDFIDGRPSDWSWQEGDSEVPIILPADYLALYNFGFAPGQELPQISEDLARMTVFNLIISGNGNQVTYQGKIAGFSDRLNTILVPQTFIDHGNEKFGQESPKNPSRLIVKADDTVGLEQLMQKKGYETNQEKLESGRQQTIAKNILLIAMALGGLIILLSLGTFLQFSDLLIARSDGEIKTLSYLGYTHAKISNILFGQVIQFVLPAILLALGTGIWIRWYLQKFMSMIIEKPKLMPTTDAFLIFFSVLSTYLLVSFLNIRRQAKNLMKAY